MWLLLLCLQLISCSIIEIPLNTSRALNSSIKECRIYNWTRMECYWDRYFLNGKEVPVFLKYKQRVCKSSNYEKSFQGQAYKNCIYQNVSDDGSHNVCHFVKGQGFYMVYHNILLHSSNASLVSDSNFCLKNYKDIVQPDPVSSLKLKLVTSNSAELEWSAPAEDKHFIYSISYVSQWIDLFLEVNTTSEHLLLADLIPHTAYFVVIKCIPLLNSSAKGFWSNNTTIRFITLEDVPAEAPKLLPGSFMFTDENKVKIMWQPVQAQLRHGVFIYTRIRISNNNSVKLLKYGVNKSADHRLPNAVFEEHIINTSSDEVFLHLSSHKNYLVFIDQGTSVGFNNSIELKPIMIYSRKTAPPNIKITNATVNRDGLFQFSWQAVESALSHTFYWCKAKDQMNCLAPFEFEVIPGNSTYFQKHLTDYQRMIFASSSECKVGNGQIVQSGMEFVPCIYNTSKTFDTPPQSFRPVDSSSSGVIHLVWDPASCFPIYPAYFSHYEISYCLLPDCKGTRTEKISYNMNKMIVRGLISGSKMLFSIKTCLGNNTSPESSESTILIPTSREWLSGFSQFPLPMTLTVVACATALVLFGISLSLLKKLREPINIDVPEFKENSLPEAFHLK